MKAPELRTKSLDELRSLLETSISELRDSTLSLHTGELQNTRTITHQRRTVARIRTLINEKSNDNEGKEA
jgi:ribosomal protein L29